MNFPYLLLNSKEFYRLCCAAQPLIWDGRSAAFAIAVLASENRRRFEAGQNCAETGGRGEGVQRASQGWRRRLGAERVDCKDAERARFNIVEPAGFQRLFCLFKRLERQCELTVIFAARPLHESGEHSGIGSHRERRYVIAFQLSQFGYFDVAGKRRLGLERRPLSRAPGRIALKTS